VSQVESIKKVFIIIVSYNFERWMDRCLGGLRKSTAPVSVVVVDNCSSDNTIKLIEEKYPEVTLIKSQSNEGFGRANNIGIKYALKNNCDFAFLLNQDAWLDSNVIETLLELSQKHPEYGILSPVHLNGKGDALDVGFAAYSGLKNKNDLMSFQKKSQDLVSLNRVNAAFWMLPQKTLKDIGGFSPIFYHYGEDVDYINRLHYHSSKIGFSPVVYGYHDRENRKPNKDNLVFQLIEYTNINHSFLKAFRKSVLAGLKKAFMALFKEGINEFTRLFLITMKIFLQSKVIIQTRKKTKASSKYHFLES